MLIGDFLVELVQQQQPCYMKTYAHFCANLDRGCINLSRGIETRISFP
jgi:hypothetical protein